MLNIVELEMLIEQKMAAAKVPGAAISVVKGEEVIYTRGFGVTSVEDGGIPVTPQTLFKIGSVTKSMTAMVVMKLVENGLINLDQPIKHYLPWLEFEKPEYASQISLRMLLSHSSGLPSSYTLHGTREPSGLERYARSAMKDYRFIAPPNVAYSYSNPAFRLSGYIAEAVSGIPYAQLMQQYVFDPLEMRLTTLDPLVAMTYPIAQSHDLQDDGTLTVQHRYGDNTGGYPSGGVITNVLDLANYAIMHMHNGVFRGKQVLSAESVDLMQTPQISRYRLYDSAYGLGFVLETVQDQYRVFHSGLTSTFGSKLMMLPEQKTAVIMVCNRAFSFRAGMDGIINHVLSQLFAMPAAMPAPVFVQPNVTLLKEFEGFYIGAERGVAELRSENDQVVMIWNGETVELNAVHDDFYYGKKADLEVQVGLLSNETHYLMINSSPCTQTKPVTFIQLPPDVLRRYEGRYAGPDVLIVRVMDGEMNIYSVELDQWSRCVALGQDLFACDFGILEFYEQDGKFRVRQSYVYEMEREG